MKIKKNAAKQPRKRLHSSTTGRFVRKDQAADKAGTVAITDKIKSVAYYSAAITALQEALYFLTGTRHKITKHFPVLKKSKKHGK